MTQGHSQAISHQVCSQLSAHIILVLILHQLTIVECKLINIELLSSNTSEIWPDARKIKDRSGEPALESNLVLAMVQEVFSSGFVDSVQFR